MGRRVQWLNRMVSEPDSWVQVSVLHVSSASLVWEPRTPQGAAETSMLSTAWVGEGSPNSQESHLHAHAFGPFLWRKGFS